MKHRALVAVFLALCLSILTACSSGLNTQGNSLSYDDIKGSGLANLCPQISGNLLDSISIDNGQSYQLAELCLQPEKFLVKRSPLMKRQESEFLPTKLLTRESFTLDQVSGSLDIDSSGYVTFTEDGGFDFQPVTVQLPDGERVPLLFTIKGLVAKAQTITSNLNPYTNFLGTFQVPPYRTSNFIDPKGRGVATGYDAAVGLPIQADSDELVRQNVKSFEVAQGNISLRINQVNSATGEIAGLFESEQPSDTDFGAKEPMDVKIQGQFYGRIEQNLA